MSLNKLDEIFSRSKSAREYAQGYCAHLADLLSKLDFEAIETAVGLFEEAREKDRNIFFLGNGGSAATASIPRIAAEADDFLRPFVAR